MKNLIEVANEEYYNKETPILSDHEFDLLDDNGLNISNFRKKAKHFQPMGSLKKIKNEKDLVYWCGREIKVTPKLDGNSIELVYLFGSFVQAITRGNGVEGNDITDKIEHCNIFLPSDRDLVGVVSYKAEAIMKKSHQKDYDKNIRNVVAGVLNKKEVDVEELKKIDVVTFAHLKEEEEYQYNVIPSTIHNKLKLRYEQLKEEYEYEIDGLVLELSTKIYEEKDELLPSNVVALKFDKGGVDAEIGDIVWFTKKHSRISPVVFLNPPVKINGSLISRVSASNYGIVSAAGLGIGAKVKINLAGDIIPYITEVVKPSFIIPKVLCPECGVDGFLDENGVFMLCLNPDCRSKTLVKLQHIFKLFDLEYISDATIELLYENGYNTLEKIFSAQSKDLQNIPGLGEKKAANIISKLKGIIISEAQAITCAMVPGISGKSSEKLLSHFGSLDKFLEGFTKEEIVSVPDFGDALSTVLIDNLEMIKDTIESIKNCGVVIKASKTSNNSSGLNIVFTGACEQYTRKELEKILKDKGYNIQSGVNKTTNMLLTDDPDSNSSKTKKAKELGVKIVTYGEFFDE